MDSDWPVNLAAVIPWSAFMLRRRLRSRRRPKRILKARRLFLAMGVVLGVLLLTYFAHQLQLNRQAATLRTRAQHAAAQEDHTTAIDLYRRYLYYRPYDADALAEQADSFEVLTRTDSRQYGDLVKTYEAMLSIDPGRHAHRRKLINIYMKLGLHGYARRHLLFMTDSRDGREQMDPELLVWLARGYWTERKWDPAAENFRLALETRRASVGTYMEFATMLRERGTNVATHEANQVMNNLVATRPQDLEVRLTRAQYRARHGDRRGAREDTEYAYKRISGAQENAEVALLYAEYLVSEGAYPEARTVLDKTARANPDNISLTLGLAEIDSRTSDLAAAKKRLVTAAAHLPDGDSRLFDIIDRLIDNDERSAARLLMNRLQTTPESARLHGYLAGRLAAAEGDWPRAIPRILDSLPLLQQRHQVFVMKAHLALAQCHGLANSPDRQAEAYAAALNLDPNSRAAKMGLAETHAKLGRLDEAAVIYQSLATTQPQARMQLIRIRFAQTLARPESDRNWAAFDLAADVKSLPVEGEILRAASLYFRKRPAEAIAALQKVVASPGAPANAWATLALLQGMQGGNDCFATLDRGDKAVGPSADLRLARAELLAREPKSAKLKEIVALGATTTGLPGDEPYKLCHGLGQILLAMNQPHEAIPLLERATALAPFDLTSRMILADLALSVANQPLHKKMLEQLRTIDGETGPTYLVAAVAGEMASQPRPDARQLADWNARLNAAAEKRKQWGRLSVLLGNVAMMSDRPDDAVSHFRKAIDLGESSEQLIRTTVRLLMQRHADTEAINLLATAASAGRVSEDLRNQWKLWQEAREKQDVSLRWAKETDVATSRNSQDQLARARIFVAYGLNTEAHAAFGAALAANPNDPDVYVQIVRFLTMIREHDGARLWAKKARLHFAKPTTPQPGDPTRIPLALAFIAEVTKDLPELDRNYEALRQLRPTDTNVLRRWYSARRNAGLADKSEEWLASFEKSNSPEAARWARRTKALEMVESFDQFRNMSAAAALIDANLSSGKGEVEDVRARAFIDALDPTDRAAAARRYLETANRGPFNIDEFYRLARIQYSMGHIQAAIDALHEATHQPAISEPEHLALLAKLQTQLGQKSAARLTIGRLKLQLPNSWLAAAEEARLLAANGDPASALRVLLDCPATAAPEARIKLVGPHLEAIGCAAEAETVSKAWLEDADARKVPNAHTVLAEFYIRTGKPMAAITLIQARQANAPAPLTARLLAAAIRARPVAMLPAKDQPAWREEIARIDTWLGKLREAQPNDAELQHAAAQLAETDGRYEDAIALYDSSLLKASGALKQRIRLDLAQLLSLQKPLAGSRALILLADVITELGPTHEVLDARALALLADDRMADALRDIDYAITLENKPRYYFHRALILHRLERSAARRNSFEDAMKLGLDRSHLHPLEWPDFESMKMDR